MTERVESGLGAPDPLDAVLGGKSLESKVDQETMMAALKASFKEGGGAENVLGSVDSLEEWAQKQMAMAIGLPVVERSKSYKKIVLDKDGKRKVGPAQGVLIRPNELMQLFMSPDFKVGSKMGVSYQANMALDSLVSGGDIRDDLLMGDVGPGKYGREEVEVFVNEMEVNGEETFSSDEEKQKRIDEYVDELVKPETVEVLDALGSVVERRRAQIVTWDAFTQHQLTSGSEPDAAALFLYSGKATPQGPDWKAMYSGDDNKRDRVTRRINAAGMTHEELVSQGKEDLAIEGLHYTMKKGKKVIIDKKNFKNVYASGWTSETFKAWIEAMTESSDDDLLAVYESWYIAISTGLVAKHAVTKVKVGDPPLTSSLHAWLMHFPEKQAREAGYEDVGCNEIGSLASYGNKTGPRINIGAYREVNWYKSYFESATVKDEKGIETSVYDLWWNGNNALGDINWLSTDRPTSGGAGESEVPMGSFDGWLYGAFQMWKLVDKIQSTPELRELVTYTALEGFGRSMDKAFRGAVWQKLDGIVGMVTKQAEKELVMEKDGKTYVNLGSIDDPYWDELVDANRNQYEKVKLERADEIVGAMTVRTTERNGVKFIQTVKDIDNPRYLFIRGILSRYAPFKEELRDESLWDASLTPEQRFGYMSSTDKRGKAIISSKGVIEAISPGVPLEDFIHSVIDANLLTWPEMETVLRDVYKNDFVDSIIGSSKGLAGVRDDVAESRAQRPILQNPVKGFNQSMEATGKILKGILGKK